MKPEDFFKRVPFDQADEHTHQVALFCWAANNVSNNQRLQLLHAIPNGGERNKIVAARIKAEGARSGIPDVFLPVAAPAPWTRPGIPTTFYHGLYIEMKRPSAKLKRQPKDKWDTGGVSNEQKIMLTLLEQQGYKCVVCYSWYEAANEIKFYLTGKGLDDAHGH